MNPSMNIELVRENSDEIESVLQRINGRATSFPAITNAAYVFQVANCAAKRLEAEGVTLEERAAAEVVSRPEGPNKYLFKRAVAGTTIRIRFGADGKSAYLVGVEKAMIKPGEPDIDTISLKPSSHASWLSHRPVPFAIIEQHETAVG